MALNCVWSLLGFVVPVVTLIYCNVHLVDALRESRRTRRLYVVNSRGGAPTACGNRVTPTFAAINNSNRLKTARPEKTLRSQHRPADVQQLERCFRTTRNKESSFAEFAPPVRCIIAPDRLTLILVAKNNDATVAS